MRIEHVAMWTRHLEELKGFYQTYLGATAGGKYVNRRTSFESYFLTFERGARLELMRMPGIAQAAREGAPVTGPTHLAFGVGSEQAVDQLTARLRADGYGVLDGPRCTGDGYYESVVLDPDGNQVEITV